eukprot:5714917-Pyramimonas_sp.AAC.1
MPACVTLRQAHSDWTLQPSTTTPMMHFWLVKRQSTTIPGLSCACASFKCPCVVSTHTLRARLTLTSSYPRAVILQAAVVQTRGSIDGANEIHDGLKARPRFEECQVGGLEKREAMRKASTCLKLAIYLQATGRRARGELKG